jgi:hypothetical protein
MKSYIPVRNGKEPQFSTPYVQNTVMDNRKEWKLREKTEGSKRMRNWNRHCQVLNSIIQNL